MLVIFILFGSAIASAVTDPTIESDPDGKQGWYSAPNYRGTLDIIWPCLLTVFLCCWTAVHPDIPHPRSTLRERYIERTVCLLLGAIAPEIIIAMACEDRSRAYWNRLCVEDQVGEEKWTLTHAHYAVIGGYTTELEIEPIEDGTTHNSTYMLQGSIVSALQSGRLSEEHLNTEDAIKDKGKSDGRFKGLALLQLVWLCLQCVARLIQHLPLTTLEISTLAYVPCAMLMYYFW